MKTLGQVAYEESEWEVWWPYLTNDEKSVCENVARAVADRVREDCAKLCEAEGSGHRDGFGEHCAVRIRAMKP